MEETYRDRYVPDSAPPKGFWRRQFSGDPTPGQRTFDLLLGAVFPIGCLVFDPIVFRNLVMGGGGYLAEYRIAAYIFIGFEILILGLWLLTGSRFRGASGLVSGALFCGSLGGMALGLAILPLSLFGVMFLFGILGFTPFLTSFVFLRNGIRSARLARTHVRIPGAAILLVCGALSVAALPVAGNMMAHRMIERSLSEITDGDGAGEEGAIARLRWLGPLAGLDRFVSKYRAEEDPDRRDRLARAYLKITGHEITSRQAGMVD